MELEWDEEKRLRNLLERKLDFADVERFDPASVKTVSDIRKERRKPLQLDRLSRRCPLRFLLDPKGWESASDLFEESK
jgi:hypothetical protein